MLLFPGGTFPHLAHLMRLPEVSVQEGRQYYFLLLPFLPLAQIDSKSERCFVKCPVRGSVRAKLLLSIVDAHIKGIPANQSERLQFSCDQVRDSWHRVAPGRQRFPIPS